MMNQQPDNFFRENLQSYTKPAPGGAWDRIESNLAKTKRPFAWWWKIAASLLLFITVAYLLWPASKINSVSPLAHTHAGTQNTLSEKENSETLEAHEIVKKNTEPVNDVKSTKALGTENKATKKNKTEKVTLAPAHTKRATALSEEDEKNNESIEVDAVTTIIYPPEEVKNKPASKTQHLTLTVTLEETNEYLDKNAVAQATSEEKKSSTFKKLLKKANDLKSNQDPFGDLREKKNEILALNFKNEKRGQNK